MSALNVSTTLGAPSTSTGALPVAPPIPTMRNPREATLPPSARLDGNSASRLLAHWPQGLDPQLLTSPPSTLKLAIYQQINQKLTEWQDPNCPSYCPGPSHWPALLDHGRFLLIGGGERGGKSRFSSQETAARVTATRLAGKKKAKYWLCGFSYEKTHNEFLNLILLFQALGALPLNLPPTNPYVRKPEGRAWSMRLMGDWDGVEIETRSVEDPATIASWPLDGALLCEPAFCDEEVWLKLRARVAERKGWVIMAGTFERMRGQWYKALFLRWQTPGLEGKSYSFPTWENYELFPGGWADPEIQRIREGVDEDWFMERFAGVPVKPTSLVFRQFEPSIHVQPHVTFQSQIGTYEWRGESLVFSGDNTADKWPVELAVDPGNADYAILAIQRGEDDQGGPLVYVFDELFGRNQDTTQLIEICRERPWWKNVNMAYPGTIDTAAKARTGSIPVNKVWRDQGVPLRVRWVRVNQGIDKLRSFLRDFGKQALMDKNGERLYPNARDWARVFVSPRCKRLIEEFQMMRFPERQDPSEWADPERGHDHGIKALWYFLMDRYPGTGRGYETERSGALIFTNG